eukprot:CAMPEP_0183551768 /NCGR_PEP_ID=MMETSP0371-20130417/70604_1 /TAXON_ID=268820 /ORGANISM="Peridinium aciculiferum, Strain PAER-2" /LENGTH=44 /DNA_ID= /DNA_START= /DNA_END= /DNA_ORIENTATION=
MARLRETKQLVLVTSNAKIAGMDVPGSIKGLQTDTQQTFTREFV